MMLRTSILLILLLGVFPASSALAESPTTQPTIERRLDGSLLVWGGGDVPEPIITKIRDAAPARGSIVVVTTADHSATGVWKRQANRREQWIDVSDQFLPGALKSADVIWIDLPGDRVEDCKRRFKLNSTAELSSAARSRSCG